MPDALPPRTGLLKYTGTPEEQAQATEMYLQGLQGLPIGVASQVTTPNFTTPEGRTDWGNWRNYVPGLPSYLYSGAAGIVEMAGNALLRNTPTVDVEGGAQLTNDATRKEMVAAAPQFTVPGHEAATALNEESVRRALQVIPHIAPTTEAGKVGQDIGVGMGQGASAVLPEFAGPKALTLPLKMLAPPIATAPIGAVIGGITGAITPPEGTPDMPEVMHLDDNGDIQPGPKAPLTSDATPVVAPTQVAEATPSKPWSFSLISSAEAATPPAATIKVPSDVEVVQMPAQAPAPVAPLPPVRPGGEGYFTLPRWEDMSYLQAGGALLGGAALMWGVAKHGRTGINTIADGIAGRTRSVVEAEQALRNPVPKTGTRVEMPLPGDAGGASTRLAATNLDPNAVVNKVSRAPEINPRWQDADAQVATNDLINNPGNANRRIENLFRTGQEEGTGYQFPKIVDYKIKSNNLTAGQQESADAYAWMKSELNLRNQNIKEAAKEGIYWTRENDKQFRVSFDQMDTETMRRSVETLERDPAIVAWHKEHNAFPDSLVDWHERNGLITSQQAQYARDNYPDFMPTIDADGKYTRSWEAKKRTPGSGYTQPPAAAWDAMIKHFGTSIQEGQRVMWQRDWLLNLERQQKANLALGQMVRRSEYQTGGPVQVLDPNMPRAGTEASLNRNITVPIAGKPVTFEVNSTPLWEALHGGPQHAAMSSGIARGIRNVFTNATTGPLSTLTGGPFAAITAIRDTMLLPTQLPRNLWRGEAERALGRRLPWGYDPTFPISVGKAAGADATTAIMKHVTDMFSDRNNYLFKDIRFALEKLLGPQKVEALASWLHAHVTGAEMRRGAQFGLGTSGNRAALNINPRLSDIGGSFRDPTANTVAPLLSRPNFKLIPDRVKLPNFQRAVNGEVRGVVESYFNLRALAHELYEVLASAPHSAAYRLNRGHPDYTPRALANAIHTVTGNPGTRGTGKAAQILGANVPFYNSNVQGAAAALRSFRENPVALGARVAYIMTLAALGSQLSALLSGKEHVDDLENRISNTTQVGNVIFYHGPGTPPANHTEIPMVNEWMGIWPYFKGLAGHFLGTWTAHQNEDTLSRIIHSIAGAFDSHISTDDVLRTGVGTVRAAVPVSVPPAVNAVVGALTDQSVRDVPEQIMRNAIQGDPLWSGFTSGGGPKHQVPGQEGSNGVLLRADSGALHSLMSTLGAAFGTAWDLVHNFENRAKVDASYGWAYEGLQRDWQQQMYDKTKYFNGVWQKNLPRSTFGPLEERTNRMWSHTAATANVNSDIRAEGFSGMKNAVPLVKVGESPLPKDPQMQDLYFTVAKYGKYISARMMPEENQIRAQIQNLKEAPFMPEEKRRIENKLSDQLYQVVTKKHEMLMQMNAELSERLGGRHFDIGSNINWQGTVEQFHY